MCKCSYDTILMIIREIIIAQMILDTDRNQRVATRICSVNVAAAHQRESHGSPGESEFFSSM